MSKVKRQKLYFIRKRSERDAVPAPSDLVAFSLRRAKIDARAQNYQDDCESRALRWRIYSIELGTVAHVNVAIAPYLKRRGRA